MEVTRYQSMRHFGDHDATGISRVLEPKQDKTLLATYTVMVVGATIIVWFDVIAGLVVTMVRGV